MGASQRFRNQTRDMKLLAGLSSAAAGLSVICNNGVGDVEMRMSIEVGDLQQAPDLGDGWVMNAGNTAWEKTFVPEAGDTTETSVGGAQFLTVNKVVDSNGCEKESVDGVEVCVSSGHQLTFTCNYPLADQNISTDTDFTVSGSDTTDSATNTGSLYYALTIDNSAGYEIGNVVSATITPLTTGLVTATILNCEVKNTDPAIVNNEVSLINADLAPVCDLGVAITTGQGDSALAFTWNAFKWSTTQGASSEESQTVECSISLAVNPATVDPQSCTASQTNGQALPVGWSVETYTMCAPATDRLQPGSPRLSWMGVDTNGNPERTDELVIESGEGLYMYRKPSVELVDACKALCLETDECTLFTIDHSVRTHSCGLWSSCTEEDNIRQTMYTIGGSTSEPAETFPLNF